MGANENDTEHIWLRQSVTFTVDGQTRTLEIGVPLPLNATAQDITALLGVADAGMQALSRRLDAQIATALAGSESGGGMPTPTLIPPTAPETLSINGQAPAELLEPPEPLEQSAHLDPMDAAPAPSAETNGARPREHRAAQPPRAPANTPTAATPRPAAAPPAPEHQPERQRPTAVAPRSQAPAAPTSPIPPIARPSPAASAPAGEIAGEIAGEMTRPQFLAAAAALGLNPRQAMDRLRVRSLEGLNLREALESLRRQMLGAAATPEAEPEITPAPAPVPEETAPSATPRYFDEEDETIPFSIDDDDDLAEDDLESVGSVGTQPPVSEFDEDDEPDELDPDELDPDELDLEDVPDLSAPPPVSAPRRTPRPAPRKAAHGDGTVREMASPATGVAASGPRTQAMQVIGKLRAAAGGGTASDYQRNAYRNIVEDQLGKPQATALVRGLWRATPDRLSAAQLDALIRWGKEEAFAEEAEQALAALRAEQRRAEHTEAPAPGSDHPAGPRTTARGRAAGGPR